MDEDKNVEANKPYDHVFGVNLNVDIPISDDERAISALYALQKKKANKNEYLDSKLMAQIDTFPMYDIVVETLQHLQEENVCPVVPITPKTRLEDLFPVNGREGNWKRFIRELQNKHWETERAEYLNLPKSIVYFDEAFGIICFLSLFINAYCISDSFPQWLNALIFLISQFMFFFICLYVLLRFIMQIFSFKLYTMKFKKQFDTVGKLVNYLKEINLFRITDPDEETLAKSGCPILKNIIAILSRLSKIPEDELKLHSRLDSIFHGNKAYSIWNQLISEMEKDNFNLPIKFPQKLSSHSINIKWFLSSINWFFFSGFVIGIGYVLHVDKNIQSNSGISIIDSFITNPLFKEYYFLLLIIFLGFSLVLFLIMLVLAFIAIFDYFLFPRYSFPVRCQTIANLVNRYRAANLQWLAKNCPESLDVKLRTLAFPNEKQKVIIEKLRSALEKYLNS